MSIIAVDHIVPRHGSSFALHNAEVRAMPAVSDDVIALAYLNQIMYVADTFAWHNDSFVIPFDNGTEASFTLMGYFRRIGPIVTMAWSTVTMTGGDVMPTGTLAVSVVTPKVLPMPGDHPCGVFYLHNTYSGFMTSGEITIDELGLITISDASRSAIAADDPYTITGGSLSWMVV